jgi:hypothetical protein
VASKTLMELGCFFSAAATLATGEQRIMKAAHPSAQPRCIHSSEDFVVACRVAYDRSPRLRARAGRRGGAFVSIGLEPNPLVSRHTKRVAHPT